MTGQGLTVLGDSFVEGRGDPVQDGGYRGWVPRFAGQIGLRSSRVRNLGTHGATTGDVVETQLASALGSRAPLVGVVVGVNDLVSDYAPDRFARNLRTIFGDLRGSGATVFTATYPDIPARLPVPDGFKSLLRERFAEANDVLVDVVTDTGSLLIDLRAGTEWGRDDMWTSDGLHPSPEGHRSFAAAAADLVSRASATTLAA
ncbi:SGNH/GDSL hydrolase family protein [Rhodococcus jostii]|uniref:Lysophospholipase L1 n=1 Tax=Rhodococcus jostii TaxID=132919 RepID=A0A1H5MJP1_RHOJO|nr:SGNH/GDSL hydrolase family protein [Rhodococcus jostii]TQC45021.1 SGNH/GDSL hydrolase family protein [Rhodococcus sp. WS4]SEE89612.1 Lysophospholipase L1 [Rhodococcus jostii]